MTLSVIIITLKRHKELARCLACLDEQQPHPDQVVVVDASPDDLSRRVAEQHNASRVLNVTYVRNDIGGFQTQSRNISLHHATGDILAFLDDDSYVHEGWCRELLKTYAADANIVAVGGRALNSVEGEADEGVDKIGKLDENGGLHGYFAADPKKIIDVDHLIGCNMSIRRDIMAKLGGFREGFPGISGVREETDVFMRIRQLPGRIVFNPNVVATHIGASQAIGRRFDLRYEYYNQRNHLVMLISNFGFPCAIVQRYLVTNSRHFIERFPQRLFRRERHPIVVVASVGVYFAATVLGLISGIKLLKSRGLSPMRHDEQAQKIRDLLKQSPHSSDTER